MVKSMLQSQWSETIFLAIADDLRGVDGVLKESINRSVVPLIKEAGAHIIFSGGKRLRPALAILSSKICGFSGEKIHYLGAAIELIHTASLIHDDVLDEADLRRGSPTANAKWGNHISILIGDYCFSVASQLLSEHTTPEILTILAHASRKTTEGEVLEVVYGNDFSLDTDGYMNVIKNKTAYLMAASCSAAARLADAPTRLVEALRDYGMNVGMAFQIVDDVLDYTIESDMLGKAKGTDLREGKLTLPVIYALKKCSPAERDIIMESLLTPGYSNENFNLVIDILTKYNSLTQAKKTALAFLRDATEKLAPFKQSIEKEALGNFVKLVASRNS